MQQTLNILIAISVRGSLFVIFPHSWQSYVKIFFSSFVAFKVMWLRCWAFIVMTHKDCSQANVYLHQSKAGFYIS